jgi:hypothetical protein
VIDLEQILVIAVGSLVLANFVVALALTIDRRRVYVRARRAAKYYRVHWSQLTDADRAVMRWMGRAVWVMVLLMAAAL